MAAAMDQEFDSWLSSKLLKINADTDIEVFVGYIKSILDDNDSNIEEKKEYVIDFLGQISEDGLESYCEEIMTKYGEKEKNLSTDNKDSVFDTQLASAIEKNKHQVVVKAAGKAHTREDEERRRAKQAILQQYEQVSDGDADADDDEGDGDGESLAKNVNAKLVLERSQAEREKNKQDSDKKKQKDKEDREKQKQKVEERKETEKKRTQKGEKKR